jgi:hypothetical protein
LPGQQEIAASRLLLASQQAGRQQDPPHRPEQAEDADETPRRPARDGVERVWLAENRDQTAVPAVDGGHVVTGRRSVVLRGESDGLREDEQAEQGSPQRSRAGGGTGDPERHGQAWADPGWARDA